MKLVLKYERYKAELIKILKKGDFKTFGQHLAVPTHRGPVFKIEKGVTKEVIFLDFAYKNTLGQVVRTRNKITHGFIPSRG